MIRELCTSAVAAVAMTASHHAVADIDCTLAPSQSVLVSRIAGIASGGSATVAAVAQATGLSVVAHSSGAYILTGSGGYVAGTLGGAIIAPAIVVVSLGVGATAATVELLCAPTNHPEEVARIKAASEEFMQRAKDTLSKTPEVMEEARDTAASYAANAKITGKKLARDIYEYAYGVADRMRERWR